MSDSQIDVVKTSLSGNSLYPELDEALDFSLDFEKVIRLYFFVVFLNGFFLEDNLIFVYGFLLVIVCLFVFNAFIHWV